MEDGKSYRVMSYCIIVIAIILLYYILNIKRCI